MRRYLRFVGTAGGAVGLLAAGIAFPWVRWTALFVCVGGALVHALEQLLRRRPGLRIPVARYVEDPSLPLEERHARLLAHHEEETRFLVGRIRELL